MDLMEYLWRLNEDLFKIDTKVMINGERSDIYISINPFFGVTFRDDMGYAIYNKELTIKGGF